MHLLIFGLGYSARYSLDFLEPHIDSVAATTRSGDKARRMEERGIVPILFDGLEPSPGVAEALEVATHILVSAAPDEDGDAVLRQHGADIARAAKSGQLGWIGYFSTVGVYGDTGGEWVDETFATNPSSERSRWRVKAEDSWLQLGETAEIPTAILRLAGIYGPGRNALVNLKAGTARRIVKPGQVFNRIHVDDIVQSIAAAFRHPRTCIWNLCDDEPAPPQEVVTYAASLMGISPPPEQDFVTADMSPIARSFYASNNRISNTRLKQELGVKLAFPTYREGLDALWRTGGA